MTPGEIQALLEDTIRAGSDAASAAPTMTDDELRELETQIVAALPIVMESEPGTYPLDLPHRMALALVSIIMGATLDYNEATGAVTRPETGR